MAHARRVVLTAPIPTVEQVARRLGRPFPHATIELTGGQRRLDRITELLRSCEYSFHDLSRVTLDRTPPATPRFNMPFELGLAVALPPGRHEWFVFEQRRHRLTKSLSDLNGTDLHIHDGHLDGVLHALANALVRREHRPSAAQWSAVYEDLCTAAVTIKLELQTHDLFEARAFDELRLAARIGAETHIPSLRRRRRAR